ncbi:MAG: hypothetical protein KBC27_03685, partial [Rickettsiales bacterium]|nr:hypothetical protein [Rickettsiales bacterium]
MIKRGTSFIKKFLHSSKNEELEIRPKPQNDFPEAYLKNTDHLILGVRKQESCFVSKKLNNLLS